jgi:hypothetical protein
MSLALCSLTTLVPLLQEPRLFQEPKAADSVPGPAVPAAKPDPVDEAGRVEALRQRIHGMRMDLLLGGENVRQAEGDARRFYQEKIELVEKRLDELAAELAEARSAYQLLLDKALTAKPDERARTLGEAREQHARIAALESEEGELSSRRTQLEKLVQSVDNRTREREKLSTKVESEAEAGGPLAFPLADIGLAPEVELLAPGSPLDDEGLVGDLLARDPVAARSLLYAADPKGYWTLFPLQPPETALRSVLQLPPPDLPGQR